jgi:uncharacterized protein (TIGR00730 family)
MNVAVFCSSAELSDGYVTPARELAEGLARRGHGLVWGGSNTGLMGVVASAIHEGGGRIVGVSLEIWREDNHADAHEMLMVETLGERKAAMLERSDAVVVLPGGLGTLDELTEVIELKRNGVHDKPIVVLNTAGFYDGLRALCRRMSEDGFLRDPIEHYADFIASPDEALERLERVTA